MWDSMSKEGEVNREKSENLKKLNQVKTREEKQEGNKRPKKQILKMKKVENIKIKQW